MPDEILTKKNQKSIYIQGAKEHNLKNVSIHFPRNQFIVVTGVSGSGKSSLTIDTLFAEGQRRYVESLSAYARQFLNRMHKPEVEFITGLCPAIAIEQKVTTRTPRSTVGTLTEIYDYLRLLFARIGKTFSPISGMEVKKDDISQVLNKLSQWPFGSKLFLLANFKKQANRNIKEELNILMQKGFSRVCSLNSKVKKGEFIIYQIETLLNETEVALKKMSIEYILIDRLVVKHFDESDLHRISDSIETAFYEGDGNMHIYTELNEEIKAEKLTTFNNKFEKDGLRFEEPEPNLFSFNNPLGACIACEGFGEVLGIDKDLVIPNKSLSIFEGAVAAWKGEKMDWWRTQFILKAGNKKFPIHKPVIELTNEQLEMLWNGIEGIGINDFFKEVETQIYKVQYRVLLSRYRGKTTCTVCKGYRIKPEALFVKINNLHIGDCIEMPIFLLQKWINHLSENLSEFENKIAKRILIELNNRLSTLLQVGLGYLTLNRKANTLSGGESQRIQLTRCLGSNLTNSIYILDEPSIGLHPRDTSNLIQVLHSLRDLQNTVIVVEHDEMMMREAQHIIDMGPLASYQGGEVVAEGNYDQIIQSPTSLTAKYLSGQLKIEPPSFTRNPNSFIEITEAKQNNLKSINVKIPLNVFCVVSGVSGSGKTTLVKQILYPALQKIYEGHAEKQGLFKAIGGNLKAIQGVEMIDQNPIGKSSRSNPVTYIKVYDSIREIFSQQPLSKMRNFQPKHFSFNVDGGRCDTCKGEGEQLIEMQFLADIHLTCETCNGKRFKEEVLEVKLRENNIFNVLEMSVDEAIMFFNSEPHIAQALEPLAKVGLGYIKLGQSSNTLSGGEAQRVKLASYLGKGNQSQKLLFIFDEPTTGLHFHDIKKLLASFNALIEKGHSILVIEHNTDVIKSADWVIDLGPEAGEAGGNLIFEGTPAQLKKCKQSITAKYI